MRTPRPITIDQRRIGTDSTVRVDEAAFDDSVRFDGRVRPETGVGPDDRPGPISQSLAATTGVLIVADS